MGRRDAQPLTRAFLSRTTVPERFATRFRRGPGCWEWLGTMNAGYGQIRSFASEPAHRAHRVAWVLAYGDLPADLFVCHRCDNKRCVRPDHLYLGTLAENTRDAGLHGLMSHGGERWNSSLTDADVIAMRRLRKTGVYPAKIAPRFGITRRTAYRAITGESWAHLNAQEPPWS